MNAIVPSSHLPEPDRVWLRMVRLNGQMAVVIAKALREIDLSIPQCDVLSILIDREGSSQQDLAERLYVTKGNISGLIDRLTIAGLVERRAIEEDRRAHAIHLTVKGRALALRGVAIRRKVVAQSFGRLSEDQLSQMDALLVMTRDILRSSQNEAKKASSRSKRLVNHLAPIARRRTRGLTPD